MTGRAGTEVATLAGGCFWCLEAIFEEVDGVEEVISGYTGGTTVSPTYQEVCTKKLPPLPAAASGAWKQSLRRWMGLRK